MTTTLSDQIARAAACCELPDSGAGRVLSGAQVRALAANSGRSFRHIELMALAQGIVPVRYLRNMKTIGPRDQARLLESHVVMAGLGGLGGYILESMARIGVGIITAADNDFFEESNLNRQLLCVGETIGAPKSGAARIRCMSVNPSIELCVLDEYLDEERTVELLKQADLAVDALGGLDSRQAFRNAASKAGVPMVTGAMAGWTGYLSVALPDGPSPSDLMGHDNSAEEILGCPAPAVQTVAALMSVEIVNMLIHNKSALAGKMLIMDLQDMSFESITL